MFRSGVRMRRRKRHVGTTRSFKQTQPCPSTCQYTGRRFFAISATVSAQRVARGIIANPDDHTGNTIARVTTKKTCWRARQNLCFVCVCCVRRCTHSMANQEHSRNHIFAGRGGWGRVGSCQVVGCHDEECKSQASCL